MKKVLFLFTYCVVFLSSILITRPLNQRNSNQEKESLKAEAHVDVFLVHDPANKKVDTLIVFTLTGEKLKEIKATEAIISIYANEVLLDTKSGLVNYNEYKDKLEISTVVSGFLFDCSAILSVVFEKETGEEYTIQFDKLEIPDLLEKPPKGTEDKKEIEKHQNKKYFDTTTTVLVSYGVFL
jgi:hypothetical protein